MVSGSKVYKVSADIKTLKDSKWQGIKTRCAGQIGSLLELLSGKLSESVMAEVTDSDTGLFPRPNEIDLKCNCPDGAYMCKHVAATLYGVAARLDDQPEILFLLRGVDHEELISSEVCIATATAKTAGGQIANDDLGDIFGIDISKDVPSAKKAKAKAKAKAKTKAKVKTNAKAKPNPAKSKPKVSKTTASHRSGTLPITGESITTLRTKFGISQSQFAKLLGVSNGSITNWEKNTGPLNLHPRSAKAFRAAKRLSKRKALAMIEEYYQ